MDRVIARWKNWVVRSLLSGRPAHAIATELDRNGFCPELIQRFLGTNLNQPVEYRCPSSRYKKLMSPAFLQPQGSYQPRALCNPDALQLYAIDDFLSRDECQNIMALAREKLTPSSVAGAASTAGIRTSSTCELAFLSHPTVITLNHHIVDTLALEVGENEVIQAQHYAPGQYYKPHYDFFPPGTPQFLEHCATRGQRTWTCMIYLNDDFTGGHTTFTRMNLSVQPKQGMALLWNNLTATGEPNRNSMHYAEPVESGEKLVVTKWFRDS